MKLEQVFEVAAPVERVWATLIDVEAVAPCLPGAELTGTDDDGAFRGTFAVKLGPTSAAYAGSLRLESVDEDSYTVIMRADGSDKRGQGTAKATIESRVEAAGDKTRVAVVTDFTITGRLARFGRGGLMQDVANRLLRDFASCLETRIGEGATDALLDRAAASASAQPTVASPEETGTVMPARQPPNAKSEPPAPSPRAAKSEPAASSPPSAKPIAGGSLFLGVIRDRIRRWLRRLQRS
jgi:carbon monoxide dehydrogenase subunit G